VGRKLGSSKVYWDETLSNKLAKHGFHISRVIHGPGWEFEGMSVKEVSEAAMEYRKNRGQ
jgi:hypothetical protein